ncbi:MAG: response regulator, partial [Deltaproteobacteria bacterium]|nr:response regulator [Deltaproteobacteria bacterium]
QIEQVVLNLAVNARDAMPEGGKLLVETNNTKLDESYVNGHVGSTPGPYVMVSISDTGCGIPPDLRERIFDPFFTTKSKGKGTGLGLSTAYGIVKQMGGYIWVHSEPGEGSTFKICLPSVVEEPLEVRARDVFKSMPRGTETILLVEDEPLLRGVVMRTLREQGYRILEAANGLEALQLLHDHPLEGIALLLTDVVMPQMGGKDLADRVRSMSPRIKVLYMSGYTDTAIVDRGILIPGIHFLQKPFTPTALAKKVREVLESV